jgi:TatD DNase family protein
MLIDTHAHLFWDSYKDDLEEVLDRALQAQIGTIINVGVDLKSSDIVRNLKSDKLPFFAAIAIHPEDVIKYSSDEDVSIHKDISRLGELISQNTSNPTKIVAVGECGLDYYFAQNPWTLSIPGSPALNQSYFTPDKIKSLQKKLFQAQIELAKSHDLPLLIHCRDDRTQNPTNSECWSDCIKMSQDHFGIYHCYSGFLNTTYQILNTTQFLISFAANITYPKNDYLREAAKIIPLERIALETDCPFLSPQSSRGQRNEPTSVLEVAKTIAEVKAISLEEVALQTTKNVKALLKI